MTAVTEMGGIVFPPLPAFYNKPASIDELVDDTVERVLALLACQPKPSPNPGPACAADTACPGAAVARGTRKR